MLRNPTAVVLKSPEPNICTSATDFTRNISKTGKKDSSCCDECCGLVEKSRNRNPGWIFADRCAVDFPAVQRKTQSIPVGEPCGLILSTIHPHHSHAIPTPSPHLIRVTNVCRPHPNRRASHRFSAVPEAPNLRKKTNSESVRSQRPWPRFW